MYVCEKLSRLPFVARRHGGTFVCRHSGTSPIYKITQKLHGNKYQRVQGRRDGSSYQKTMQTRVGDDSSTKVTPSFCFTLIQYLFRDVGETL